MYLRDLFRDGLGKVGLFYGVGACAVHALCIFSVFVQTPLFCWGVAPRGAVLLTSRKQRGVTASREHQEVTASKVHQEFTTSMEEPPGINSSQPGSNKNQHPCSTKNCICQKMAKNFFPEFFWLCKHLRVINPNCPVQKLELQEPLQFARYAKRGYNQRRRHVPNRPVPSKTKCPQIWLFFRVPSPLIPPNPDSVACLVSWHSIVFRGVGVGISGSQWERIMYCTHRDPENPGRGPSFVPDCIIRNGPMLVLLLLGCPPLPK